MRILSILLSSLLILAPIPAYSLDNNLQILHEEKFDDKGNEGSWNKGYLVDFRNKNDGVKYTYVLTCKPDSYSVKNALLLSDNVHYEVEIQKGGPFASSEETAYQFWNHYCK